MELDRGIIFRPSYTLALRCANVIYALEKKFRKDLEEIPRKAHELWCVVRPLSSKRDAEYRRTMLPQHLPMHTSRVRLPLRARLRIFDDRQASESILGFKCMWCTRLCFTTRPLHRSHGSPACLARQIFLLPNRKYTSRMSHPGHIP